MNDPRWRTSGTQKPSVSYKKEPTRSLGLRLKTMVDRSHAFRKRERQRHDRDPWTPAIHKTAVPPPTAAREPGDCSGEERPERKRTFGLLSCLLLVLALAPSGARGLRYTNASRILDQESCGPAEGDESSSKVQYSLACDPAAVLQSQAYLRADVTETTPNHRRDDSTLAERGRCRGYSPVGNCGYHYAFVLFPLGSRRSCDCKPGTSVEETYSSTARQPDSQISL